MLKAAFRFGCRALDRLISTAFLALVLLVLLYAAYVEYDTIAMISDASSNRYQSYKPVADDTLSFEQLRAQNPDVIGWITLDDTQIDYPIVQGESNSTYINTSVLGDFSLTGAIFLDSRNASDFTDPLSILYGHNMVGDVMFGSLHHYLEEAYFQTHQTGTLYDGKDYYSLRVFACLEADGHDTEIYRPALKQEDLSDWVEQIAARAKVSGGKAPSAERVLLLSTCASGPTNNRTLLAATITPGGTPPVRSAQDGALHRFLAHFAAWRDYTVGPLGVLVWFLLLLELTILYWVRRAKSKRKIRDEKERSLSAAGG